MKSLNYSQIKILLFLTFVLSNTSCTSSNTTHKDTKIEKGCPIIDLAYAVENPGESLPLSDFVEDIEYIRPEYPATLISSLEHPLTAIICYWKSEKDSYAIHVKENLFVK